MRNICGFGAAMAAAGILTSNVGLRIVPEADLAPPLKPYRPKPGPNDFGPVIDTTPESKRARRRRLARAVKGGENG